MVFVHNVDVRQCPAPVIVLSTRRHGKSNINQQDVIVASCGVIYMEQPMSQNPELPSGAINRPLLTPPHPASHREREMLTNRAYDKLPFKVQVSIDHGWLESNGPELCDWLSVQSRKPDANIAAHFEQKARWQNKLYEYRERQAAKYVR
jgi:hypothetical protein